MPPNKNAFFQRPSIDFYISAAMSRMTSAKIGREGEAQVLCVSFNV
jgi:hypothetical protein